MEIRDLPIEPEDESSAPESSRKKGKKTSLMGNLVWTFFRAGGVAVVQFVVMLVLSHKLTPEELGWSAALSTITYLAQITSQMGIAPAIIQRPVLSDAHLATGMLASLISGLTQTAIGILMAPMISGWFKMPELVPYLQVSVTVFAFMAISRIAQTMMERELKFSLSARADLLSSYAYGMVTIIGVYAGFHVWSVVAGVVAQAIVKSALTLVGQKIPRPLRFSWDAYKDLMSVGRGFTMATILSYLAGNGDNFVVGRWLGAAALGTYSRAFQLMARPAGLLAKSIGRVLYPTMARSQDDREGLTILFLRTTTAMAILVMPIGCLASALAPEFVRVLLGPLTKWSGVIVPFEILAAGMIFRIGNQSSDAMNQAIGKTMSLLMPKVGFAVGVVVFAYIGAQLGGKEWGIVGVSWGILAANATHTFLMAQQSLKHLKIGWWPYFKAHQAPVLVSAAVSGTALMVAIPLRRLELSAFVILPCGLIAAAAVGGSLVLFGNSRLLGADVVEMRKMFTGKIRRRGKGKRASATA